MAINDDIFEETSRPDEKTIRCLRVVTISSGQMLYRFASSIWHPDFWFGSRWWLSERAYEQIQREMVKSNIPNWIARTALGVKVKWDKQKDITNLMDIVVRARVLCEIKAWSGHGKPQYETAPNSIRIKWGTRSGSRLDIEQYFIPGISDDRGLTKIGRQALQINHNAIYVKGKQPWT